MNKYLVTIALFLVFGTSAYMSIYGLTAVFTGMTVVVIGMGIGMELGKILAVVHLHRNWQAVGWCFRFFFVTLIGALTFITSMEVLGFLTQRHAGSTKALAAIDSKVSELEREAEILRGHIAVVDQTLAGLPAGYVTKRFREREAAGYGRMRDRLLEIMQETARLKASAIANAAYSAPIFAASRIFTLDPQKTISIFVLILVAVLEPLAIGLAVASSSLWQKSGKINHRAAETATDTAKAAAKTAKEPIKAAHPYTIELRAIAKRHNLKIMDITKITSRKKLQTVQGWLEERPIIPIKALRVLRRWAATQPAIGLMKSGYGYVSI
jgi:hypothetical protein